MQNAIRVSTAFAGAALAVVLYAQSPKPQAAFVAAAIKLDPNGEGQDVDKHPGFVHAQMTLRDFIAYAYDLRPFQVSGGPKWIASEHYAIDAKMDQAAPATTAQIRSAIQGLLAERFGLKFHRETKEAQGYALVIAKGGLKLTPDMDNGGSGMNSTGFVRRSLEATRASMDRLSGFLAGELQRPVVDQTQAPGAYTFKLQWVRDDLKREAEGKGEQQELPSLPTALQEKLGLRLEPHKTTIDAIIVDNAGRPSEN
jgi:uncharacterized protein (TIGR03435 family)